MSYINQGELEKCIDRWIKARDNLDSLVKADFRIGVKFIEHVTNNPSEALYPIASEIYIWGGFRN